MAASTATVPYNATTAMQGSATTYPVPQITPIPYLTCYFPPISGGGYSFLSTVYVRGFY